MDAEFFRKRPFLEEIADALQTVYDEYTKGNAIKISISLPPRAGKSYITSLFCSWWIGNLPELCVMRNTATSTLYRKFSYDIRAILKLPDYKKVFPFIELSPDKQNIDGWSITQSKQGAYFGGGVGTNIIGFGANLAITDDLYSGFDEALSIIYSEKVDLWKQGSHNSRMEKNCPEIYIGTRWSIQDVIGKAIEKGDMYKSISVSALNNESRSFCEEVKSTDEYLKIKADTDQMVWEAEYQQQPIEASGLLFPISELKFFDPANLDEIKKKKEYSFGYTDPANKGGDYFCSAFSDLVVTDVFVDHVFCNKDGADPNNVIHSDYICTNKTMAYEYEGVFAWQEKAKKLREMVQVKFQDCNFRIVNPTTNKQTRILAESGFIKNHFWFRSDWETIPEYRIFMKLLTTYLRNQTGTKQAKNDDPPDVLAGMASHYRKTFSHLW
ncbi:MAG TPA: hypothetical protein VF487_20340 [Chitinophagaceae bacterium]